MIRAAIIVAALMLVLGVAEFPYGYYQFLRIVTTGTLIWLTIETWDYAVIVERLVLVSLAISYNPIFKIHMERESHEVINVFTAVIICTFYLRHRKAIDKS